MMNQFLIANFVNININIFGDIKPEIASNLSLQREWFIIFILIIKQILEFIISFISDLLIFNATNSELVESSSQTNILMNQSSFMDDSDSENPKKTFFDIFIKIPLNFILNKLGFIENSSSILTEEKKILPEDLIVLSENQKSKTNIFNFSMNDNLWRYHFYSNSGFIFKFKFEENLVQSNLIEGNLIEENLIQSNLIQEIQILENPIQENIIQEIQIPENSMVENAMVENANLGLTSLDALFLSDNNHNNFNEEMMIINENLSSDSFTDSFTDSFSETSSDDLFFNNNNNPTIISQATPFIERSSGEVITTVSWSIFDEFLGNIGEFSNFLNNLIQSLVPRYLNDWTVFIPSEMNLVKKVKTDFMCNLVSIPTDNGVEVFKKEIEKQFLGLENVLKHRKLWHKETCHAIDVYISTTPYTPDHPEYEKIVKETSNLKKSFNDAEGVMVEMVSSLPKYVNEEISKNVPLDEIKKGLFHRVNSFYEMDCMFIDEIKEAAGNIQKHMMYLII